MVDHDGNNRATYSFVGKTQTSRGSRDHGVEPQKNAVEPGALMTLLQDPEFHKHADKYRD